MKSGIGIATNLEQLAESIGGYLGMVDGVEQKPYMDALLRQAHAQTLDDFHREAAAVAKSKNITHMYEYGVANITRGDVQFISPLKPEARLWVDTMVGGGGRKTISFIFREAKRRVPKHTTESTMGVDQETLDKLRLNKGKRYVFKHRAEVYEKGIDLHIRPRSAKALFVPLMGGPGSVAEQGRGYGWRKSIRTNPGEDTGAVGSFATFFYTWWSTRGAELMASAMNEQVGIDIVKAEALNASAKSGLKSPKSTNVNGAVVKGKRKTRKQFTIKVTEEGEFASKIL